jgi:amino acid synthesis protein
MIEIRKTITLRETIFSELGVEAARPITRAVGIAVIRNPFAGQFVEDLRPLFEAGAMLGERLMPDLVKLLEGPQSPMAKALSSVLRGKWSMVVPVSIQCSGNQCGPRLAAARR